MFVDTELFSIKEGQERRAVVNTLGAGSPLSLSSRNCAYLPIILDLKRKFLWK